NPKSAISSRLIIDQRIPPLREPRPWLHLDDVVEQRALESELDLLQGGAEGAPPAGPRGGARVAGEELQLGGARREAGEFDGEPLHRPRRELPHAAAGRSELRDDRFLRQRGEPAQGREPELAEPAVRVGIERQHGERLRSKKPPFLPRANDDCPPWFCPACCNPGDEL